MAYLSWGQVGATREEGGSRQGVALANVTRLHIVSRVWNLLTYFW
ncbi:hypothetical protein JOF43_001516 [Brachybacterium sacelli]|uniref:Uncharacterized protein n=1 Tax=Brachybacterium sacelli TaxID=173364 RepID=A0ABS4WZB9_9MICO|nr:hypothetical protein [Brachybacterium sacelli]